MKIKINLRVQIYDTFEKKLILFIFSAINANLPMEAPEVQRIHYSFMDMEIYFTILHFLKKKAIR